eukprot:TRINITY_DN2576_c0_g2_i2.p1 TRINITY_DN2576_c0_g2~~TRINITY_DN2576_c0_g2_i2.p1  ORF type:complete len:173 (+),score=19.48 TRINITY_DN2576_c0_g2_i2:134-652(+)
MPHGELIPKPGQSLSGGGSALSAANTTMRKLVRVLFLFRREITKSAICKRELAAAFSGQIQKKASLIRALIDMSRSLHMSRTQLLETAIKSFHQLNVRSREIARFENSEFQSMVARVQSCQQLLKDSLDLAKPRSYLAKRKVRQTKLSRDDENGYQSDSMKPRKRKRLAMDL